MKEKTICVFCGQKKKVLPGLNDQYVDCGGSYELACNRCERKVRGLRAVERCELALKSGCASQPEKLRDHLSEHLEELEATYTGLTCLRCGGRMKDGGNRYLGMSMVAPDGHGPQDGLRYNGLEARMQYCEICGKLEFYWELPGKAEK